MLDLSCLLADDKRNDIRIEAALAKLYASEMAWQIADELIQIRGGRGYETAESLAAARRAGVPGRAAAAGPADQPDLRGLHRDHAAADRPRGGRRAPVGGRRHHRSRATASSTRPRRGAQAGGFYARWLPTLAVGEGQQPAGLRRVRLAGRAPALRRAARRKLARSTFYGMARWQGKLEHKQALPRPHRRHRGGAVRHARRLRPGARCDRGSGTDGALRASWPTCSAPRPGCGSRRCSPAVEQHRHRRLGAGTAVLTGRYTWLEDGIIDPSIPGPWIAPAEPGPSKTENVHRHIS